MDMGTGGPANCNLHFLAPHPSTFGLFGNTSINFALNDYLLRLFSLSVAPGPSKKIASSKKIITF
jgi:hypothetical protein